MTPRLLITSLQPFYLDSRASSWPTTLQPLCLGREPKARVVTEALILITLNWDMEFHDHINASLLIIRVLQAHNITRKNDQPIMYASKIFIIMLNITITLSKEKPLLRFLHCISLSFICWEINLCFM